MKTYAQLDDSQQEAARRYCLGILLQNVIEGVVVLADDYQQQINEAMEEANQMQTPWFAHEYIMDNAQIADILQRFALRDAKERLYLEGNEKTIPLSCLEWKKA